MVYNLFLNDNFLKNPLMHPFLTSWQQAQTQQFQFMLTQYQFWQQFSVQTLLASQRFWLPTTALKVGVNPYASTSLPVSAEPVVTVLESTSDRQNTAPSAFQITADDKTTNAQTMSPNAKPSLNPTKKLLIDLNHATQAQLLKLNGINNKKAQDIIAYREKNQGFASIDELAKVKGIGQSTVDKNRDNLTLATKK